MKMRVLVAVKEFPLRARLAQIVQSCGYVAALARGDRREATRSLLPPSWHRRLSTTKVSCLLESYAPTAARSSCSPDSHEAAQRGPVYFRMPTHFSRNQWMSRGSNISLPKSRRRGRAKEPHQQ